MEKPAGSPSSFSSITTTSIAHLSNDLLHNIIARLPAHAFAAAACVSRAWNHISASVLSRPVLASAISLNHSLPEAMKEVMGKVFAGPMRPHFALLCVGSAFNLDEAHQLITEKLGSRMPVVTCETAGIMGRDALSDQFSEVKFSYVEDEFIDDSVCVGISLTVGYIPGLKVETIPLFLPVEGASIDDFVMDVRAYSASVSGCIAPEAIFMFGDSEAADMKPVLNKLDYGLSERTIIAGNESCRFRYQSIAHSRITPAHQGKHGEWCGAVALVFASDRTTLNCPAKIDFHFAMGTGVTAAGPTYKVVSAKMRSQAFATWLTAIREGENETLDGDQMLSDLNVEMGEPLIHYDLYIGVTKRRKVSIGSEKVKTVTSFSYHSVQDADEQYLYVTGLDIRTGDSFCFYIPDSRLALRSSGAVSENFGRLRHKVVLGGFVFACCMRGMPFFNEPNVDSSPILDNFPSIPLSGMFCGAEIGRGPSSVTESDAERDRGPDRSCLHVYSTIYVVMCCSYA